MIVNYKRKFISRPTSNFHESTYKTVNTWYYIFLVRKTINRVHSNCSKDNIEPFKLIASWNFFNENWGLQWFRFHKKQLLYLDILAGWDLLFYEYITGYKDLNKTRGYLLFYLWSINRGYLQKCTNDIP